MAELFQQPVNSDGEKNVDLEQFFQCDFCVQCFRTKCERKVHTATHFEQRSCLSCDQLLIRIDDEWYAKHNVNTCHRTNHDVSQAPATDRESMATHMQQSTKTESIDVLRSIDSDQNTDDGDIKYDFGDDLSPLYKLQKRLEIIPLENIETKVEDSSKSLPEWSEPKVRLKSDDSVEMYELYDSTKAIDPIEVVEVNEIRKKRRLNTSIKSNKKQLTKQIQVNESNHIPSDENSIDFASQDDSSSKVETLNRDNETASKIVTSSDSDVTTNSLAKRPRTMKSTETKANNNGQPKSKIQCEICSKMLLNMVTYRNHLKLLHSPSEKPAKTYPCDECGRSYSSPGNLKLHKYTHQETRPFICNYCGLGFNQLYHLQEHERIHTGERPHICKICGKGFRRITQIKVHMRVHTGEKPYKCPIDQCDRAYAHEIDLKRHKYSVHGIYTKKHICTICSKVYSENKLLKKHMQSHGLTDF